MKIRKKRLLQAQNFMEHWFPGESPHIIQRSDERAEKSRAMFRAVAPGIPLDFSGAYLYSIHNLKNQTVYWGISWKCAEGHSFAGTTLLDDLYTGSPDRSEYSAMREKQKPHDFLMIVWSIFPTPDGYAEFDTKEKRTWLKDNLGEAEKYVIKRSREALGDYAEGGLTLNVGDGGVAGGADFVPGDPRLTGENNPMKRPEQRARMAAVCASLTGEKNPQFGKLGELNHRSKKVVELVSGRVYAGACEASREIGVPSNTLTTNAKTNAKKLEDGEELTASSRRTNHLGKPSKNFGLAWLHYDVFLAEINAGRSVEVRSKL